MLRSISILMLLSFLSAPTFAGISGGSATSSEQATVEDVTLLVVYVLLALVLSFMCSVAEAVLLSITPSYIEYQKENRPKLAMMLSRLKIDYLDRSLAAILTLNTIAHTVGAIGAGAKATIVFGSMWFGLFSAVMTLMILFLSEIIPKTLGAVHWVRLVRPIALFVHSLTLVLFPLVWVSERLTRMLSRGKDLHLFSRDEFLAMARLGARTGSLDDNELRIIRNLFQFSLLKTSDIMTPRTVVTALPESMCVREAADKIVTVPFSRLPVYDKNIDHITGFVLKEDILLHKTQGDEEKPLVSLLREIDNVPETIELPALFERLIRIRKHIAVVIDEHGGTTGIVTLEDLVETLVGQEIMDETDEVRDMRTIAKKRWESRRRQSGMP